MKKLLSCLVLSVFFLIILFLQVNVFPNATIAGVLPNLLIIFVIFISLFTNSVCGISFGIVIGLVVDFLYSYKIGISSAMFGLIAFLGAYFDKNFSKDNKLTILFIVATLSLIYEFGVYFINSIILEFEMEYFYFIKKIFIEMLYNVLLVIIIYPIFQKAGYSLERIFKRNNVLTRYF